MINYIILSFIIFIELFVIILVFDNITFDDKKSYYNLKNNLKLFIEFLLLLSCVYYTSIKLTKDNNISLIFILASIILWISISFLLPLYITDSNNEKNENNENNNESKYYNDLVDENNENNRNNGNNGNNLRIPIFSKFLIKNNRNFSFNNLYGNYNKKNEDYIIKQYKNQNTNQKKKKSKMEKQKDYSEYNGYDQNHICYNCGCIKREDGYVFCGKYIPNFGTIGCSPRWKCRNCNKCKQGYNNTTDNKYECKDCKCIETPEGTICGKRGRLDKTIHKCSNNCTKCKNCDGKSNSIKKRLEKPKRYRYIKPTINLKNIIVNNISNVELEKVLR